MPREQTNKARHFVPNKTTHLEGTKQETEKLLRFFLNKLWCFGSVLALWIALICFRVTGTWFWLVGAESLITQWLRPPLALSELTSLGLWITWSRMEQNTGLCAKNCKSRRVACVSFCLLFFWSLALHRRASEEFALFFFQRLLVHWLQPWCARLWSCGNENQSENS